MEFHHGGTCVSMCQHQVPNFYGALICFAEVLPSLISFKSSQPPRTWGRCWSSQQGPANLSLKISATKSLQVSQVVLMVCLHYRAEHLGIKCSRPHSMGSENECCVSMNGNLLIPVQESQKDLCLSCGRGWTSCQALGMRVDQSDW